MKFRRGRRTEPAIDEAKAAADPMTGSVRIIKPDPRPDHEAPAPHTSEMTTQPSSTTQVPAMAPPPVPRAPSVAATPDNGFLDAPTDGVPLVPPSTAEVESVDARAGSTAQGPERTVGADPLLSRASSTNEPNDEVAPESRPAGLGRSGVRVIPATPSPDESIALDPTAPHAGPNADLVAAPDADGGSTSGITILPSAGGDSDAGRPTIVINDDGASAVGAETGVARSRIDPKFRARRRAVRRSMGRKRMAFLGVGVIVVLIGIVIGALLGSPLFALRSSQVEVTGWEYADPDEMYAIFDDLAGTPVLRIDEGEVEDRLEAVPWVEQAVVDTRLPNSATVQIRERVPLATYQGADGRFRVVDRSGRVLEIVDGMPLEYMWITVSDPPDLERGEFAATGIAAAAETTRSLTPTIRSRVRRIAVDQSGSSMAIYLRDGTRVNFGAARDIFSKLVRLETLLTDFPGMTDVRIDVSTAETTRSSASLLELTDGASDEPAADDADAATSDDTATGDTATDETTGETGDQTSNADEAAANDGATQDTADGGDDGN